MSLSRPVILVALLVTAAACHKPADVTTSTTAPPTEPPPIPPRTAGAVGDVLDAYDTLRLALAHDDADGAKAAAAKIAAAAAQPGDAGDKQTMADLAAAADKVQKAGDIGAARAAFGDVSKLVVTLVAADPALQTGRFLFLCPMAKGYQKWVQTTEKLENPYFGKSMLDCGEQLTKWGA